MNTTSIIRQLVSAYPNTQATVETIAVYDRLLADIAPGDLQTVVDQCIAECKFLPTVAEIRERYGLLTRRLGEPSAAEAWGEVQTEIRRVGYIGTPTFADTVTERVVKMMGWRELCASENAVADRAHFMRMYEQVAERAGQWQRLLPQARELAEQRIEKGGLQRINTYAALPKPPDREIKEDSIAYAVDAYLEGVDA